MLRIPRRAALAAPLILVPPAATHAQQAWPARPVVLVVPWAPGGSNDLTARLLAPHLSERFGQSFVVENRPGGGGAVGMGQAARARPDGYTLLVSSASNHVFNHFVVLDQGYDPREALAAAAMLTDVPNALAANVALGVSDVPGLVAKLKASPGMGFASSGVGSSNHLAGELFRMLTGTDIVHVPYRGGGPVISDLLANTISIAFLNLPTLLPALETGKVRLLGVGSAERVAIRPDLPTIAEQGVPNYAVRSWTGLFAPRGTPREVLARLSDACRNIMALPAVKARLDELASVPIWAGPADTDAFVQAEFDKWGPLVRAAGVKPD
ncbi:MAG: tripartite tricarboxylate transporter substrate binding protein [Acetobacteraceae bacterium]|nr:tripartite tricarboxylate transporter substrate binding protein [Acetobacteraceae bacterium]